MPGGNYESILRQKKSPSGKIEKGITNRSETKSTLMKSNGLAK